jgi:hypothetical protein
LETLKRDLGTIAFIGTQATLWAISSLLRAREATFGYGKPLKEYI